MWIVRLALRRPYTFTVMAILIVLMGIVTITRTATDIFPKIALNDLPIKQVNNALVYIRDVAHARDGFAVQTNIVAQNRVRSALRTVLKSASASTLDIILQVKAALPRIKATLPPELDITQLFDQSIFMRAAINGVLKEAVIAACLTALMILLFLGSWRSTLFGTQLEVLSSLSENEKVVMNPTGDLVEGIRVQVKSPEKPTANLGSTAALYQLLRWRRNNIPILSS